MNGNFGIYITNPINGTKAYINLLNSIEEGIDNTLEYNYEIDGFTKFYDEKRGNEIDRKKYKIQSLNLLKAYVEEKESYLDGRKIEMHDGKGKVQNLAHDLTSSIINFIKIPFCELNKNLLYQKIFLIAGIWEKSKNLHLEGMGESTPVNIEIMKKYVFGRAPIRLSREYSTCYTFEFSRAIYNLSVEPPTRSHASLHNLLHRDSSCPPVLITSRILQFQKNIISDPLEYFPKKLMTEEQRAQAVQVVIDTINEYVKTNMNINRNNNQNALQQNVPYANWINYSINNGTLKANNNIR